MSTEARAAEIAAKVTDTWALEIAIQLAEADRDTSLSGQDWSQAVVDRLTSILNRYPKPGEVVVALKPEEVGTLDRLAAGESLSPIRVQRLRAILERATVAK